MASEALGTGVHRSAESGAFDQQHPGGVEGVEGRLAAGDLSRGRPNAERRDQAVPAGRVLFGHQGPGGYRAVALVGTYELLPMNTYHIKSRPLEMRVGDPISTAGLTIRDLEALSARVQRAVEELYYQS